LWKAEDAARELPNLPLEDALQLVERGVVVGKDVGVVTMVSSSEASVKVTASLPGGTIQSSGRDTPVPNQSLRVIVEPGDSLGLVESWRCERWTCAVVLLSTCTGFNSRKTVAERGSPKYEKAAMRWLERYLAEGSPRLQHFAEVTMSLAERTESTADLGSPAHCGGSWAPPCPDGEATKKQPPLCGDRSPQEKRPDLSRA
jgi:hypothetical protein